MNKCKSEKEEFLEKYRGTLPAEAAYELYKAQERNRKRYSDATYSSAYNTQLERRANAKARLRLR